MTYLITGAAGFIGSKLAQVLIQGGNDVILVDRFSDYYSTEYKHLRVKSLIPSQQILNIDLADRSAIESSLGSKSIKTIFHLAAQPGVRVNFPKSTVYLRDNISAFSNILEFALSNGVKNFLYASSSSIYQSAKSYPFTESESLSMPNNLYAKSKWINERIAEGYLENNLSILGLRFFSAYGPWGRPDMSYLRMISAAYSGRLYNQNGDGTIRRDFTFIDDLVYSVIKLSELKEFSSKVVNIGGSYERQMSEAIKIIESLSRKSINLRCGPNLTSDLTRTLASPGLLSEMINYVPSTSLEMGLEKTVNWASNYADDEHLYLWTRD
jgi:UDP-glucuronate 4-epimerase